MTSPRFQQCDLLPLEQLFEGDGNAHDVELAAHIETCVHCMNKLETLAGDANWWRDVSQFLVTDGYTQSFTPAENIARSETSILDPTDRDDALGRLGEYEILELIGRGGNGIVFKGYQPSLNRDVAVKVLAPHLADSAAARRRFQREAEAAAAVVHENVLTIHAIEATQDGLPYLVMPLVLGGSLQRRLDRQGPLELRDILRIGMQAAAGLAAAHAQGLVHRDVKPANILLDGAASRVLLTDFGLARAADDASLTRSGVIAGTPHYMAPEQVEAQPIDARTDLFSLGGVLYTMATARPPFRAELTMAVLRRICEDAPRPVREINADLPDWFEAIVEKLLSKSADERFQTADQVADLLAACLAHVQQPNAFPLPAEIVNLTRNKRQALRLARPIAALAVLSVIAAGISLNSTWGGANSDSETPITVNPDTSAAIASSNATGAGNAAAVTFGADSTPTQSAELSESPWEESIDAELSAIRRQLDQLETSDGETISKETFPVEDPLDGIELQLDQLEQAELPAAASKELNPFTNTEPSEE